MKEIETLRGEIDKIDIDILKLLEKRWNTTKRIGEIKRDKGIDYYDPEREEKIIQRVTEKTSLNRNFIKRVYTIIVEYCRNGEHR